MFFFFSKTEIGTYVFAHNGLIFTFLIWKPSRYCINSVWLKFGSSGADAYETTGRTQVKFLVRTWSHRVYLKAYVINKVNNKIKVYPKIKFTKFGSRVGFQNAMSNPETHPKIRGFGFGSKNQEKTQPNADPWL